MASVDNAVNQAAALGAKTYVPPTGLSMGRFAVMADPQGASFGLFEASGEYPGHDREPGKGEFAWHELATSDPLAGWHFYHQLLGWDKMHAMDMGPDGLYQMFGRGGVQLGGIYKPKPGAIAGAGGSRWLCYMNVPSADAAAGTIAKLGGRVTAGPMDVPGSRIAMCTDAQGVAFAVQAYVAVAATAKPAPKAAAKPVAKKPVAKKAAKKAAPAKKKVVAAKKKASPKKNVAAKRKPIAKKKAVAKKKAAPKKKPAAKKRPAAKKKPAAKKRPAPRKKTAAKRKPVAKKGRRRS